MRDPLGQIKIENGLVLRELNQPLDQAAFLYRTEAKELVKNNQLIPYNFRNQLQITSPLLPFVSYPHEWCNAQLFDAADLTLSIAEYCENTGYELKDASSWNVIFNGAHPVFCDHLSFQKINQKNWWAFAQYVRHFIFPLCIAKYAGLNAYESFKISRDGLKPQQTKSILGSRRFLTRYWSLLVEVKSFKINLNRDNLGKHRHKNLFSLLRYYLSGVKPKSKISVWSKYVEERAHYAQTSQDMKRKTIDLWLKKTVPHWVTDFGCNTGEFSRLAIKNGAKVIAIDFDHESIQNLYLYEKENINIFPLVADLDDIIAGRGWGGKEFEGLVPRIARVNEMTLMLALIHHIAISNSIPYFKIAEFARSISKKWLIVELIDHEDPLVDYLCKQRNRSPSDFALSHQISAFEEFFSTKEIQNIEGTGRQLRLLEVLT